VRLIRVAPPDGKERRVNYGKGVPFLPRGTRYKSGKRLAERASERLSLSLSLFRSTGIGHGESVNQSRVSPRLVGEKRETRMSRVARRAIAQIRVVRLSPERRSRGTREFEYRRGGGGFWRLRARRRNVNERNLAVLRSGFGGFVLARR